MQIREATDAGVSSTSGQRFHYVGLQHLRLQTGADTGGESVYSKPSLVRQPFKAIFLEISENSKLILEEMYSCSYNDKRLNEDHGISCIKHLEVLEYKYPWPCRIMASMYRSTCIQYNIFYPCYLVTEQAAEGRSSSGTKVSQRFSRSPGKDMNFVNI